MEQNSLDFEVGARKTSLRVHKHGGRSLYSLIKVTTILGLETQEERGRLKVVGPAGELELMDGRPLVRLGKEYILLSVPCRRMAESDWYAPEDFISKVLPNILTGRMVRMTGGYRFEGLALNRVRVEVVNHPGRVSIAFLASQAGSIRISERESHLEIDFGEYLVQFQPPDTRPEAVLVSSMEFDSQAPRGGVRILKGPRFGWMRQQELARPYRTVIEIYPTSIDPASIGGARAPSADAGSSRPGFSGLGARGSNLSVITLDPGHGGEDGGVETEEDLLEKNLVLQLASQMEDRLKKGIHQPRLTRTRDIALSSTQRSAFANYHDSRAFISLHAGGSPHVSSGGGVVYVHAYLDTPSESNRKSDKVETDLISWEDGQRSHQPESFRLAQLIQAELNRLYETRNTVVRAPFTVLAPVTAPAVLVEVGFLTHQGDREKLGSIEFQEELAGAISRAVVAFLQSGLAGRQQDSDEGLLRAYLGGEVPNKEAMSP